jgi:hypothetical protein
MDKGKELRHATHGNINEIIFSFVKNILLGRAEKL